MSPAERAAAEALRDQVAVACFAANTTGCTVHGNYACRARECYAAADEFMAERAAILAEEAGDE